MSSTPTVGSAAANSSGRWVIAAPTSSPPFDRPCTASCAAVVTPESISSVAQAYRSSKTSCLWCSIPARCQSAPNSPPPRRFATASTPPAATQMANIAENAGSTGMSKPP